MEQWDDFTQQLNCERLFPVGFGGLLWYALPDRPTGLLNFPAGVIADLADAPPGCWCEAKLDSTHPYLGDAVHLNDLFIDLCVLDALDATGATVTEFLELLPPDRALAILLENLHPQPEPEAMASSQASGRVTLQEVVAPHPLPAFPRSTVDGYALRAADTHGSSEALPAYLVVVGEVPMGAAADLQLDQAECALIHTGGMLPAGADAVVMIEHTQSTRPGEVEILRPAASGENTLKVGEDVLPGQVVI